MLPGLVPPMSGPAVNMLPILQQAWLSRANAVSANSSLVQTANGGLPFPGHAGFPPFPHPFFSSLSHPGLPPVSSPSAGIPPAASSPLSASYAHHAKSLFPSPAGSPPASSAQRSPMANDRISPLGGSNNNIRPRSALDDAAEDLSSAGKRLRSDVICPICSIAVRWEDLPEHFQTEVRCLDNIRSLSPIAATRSTSSNSSLVSRRSYVSPPGSPNKSSSSLSPNTSPQQGGIGHSAIAATSGFLENRWERFERIRNKRRDRLTSKHAPQASVSTSVAGLLRRSDLRRSSSSSSNMNNNHGGVSSFRVADMMAHQGSSSREHLNSIKTEEANEDIDIGDSLSDCGSTNGQTSAETGESGGGGEGGQQYQYTEADVLRCLKNEEDTSNKKREDSVYGEEEEDEEEDEMMTDGNNEDDHQSAAAKKASDDDSRVEEDGHNDGNNSAGGQGMKCPACRGHMDQPVLNVACWHLKCERCWLLTVGTDKQCRICHTPASVRELRRVHV